MNKTTPKGRPSLSSRVFSKSSLSDVLENEKTMNAYLISEVYQEAESKDKQNDELIQRINSIIPCECTRARYKPDSSIPFVQTMEFNALSKYIKSNDLTDSENRIELIQVLDDGNSGIKNCKSVVPKYGLSDTFFESFGSLLVYFDEISRINTAYHVELAKSNADFLTKSAHVEEGHHDLKELERQLKEVNTQGRELLMQKRFYEDEIKKINSISDEDEIIELSNRIVRTTAALNLVLAENQKLCGERSE